MGGGRYEVTQIISPTAYQLLVPERRCKIMIVHVNRLKEWKDPRSGLYRVVVADEREEDSENIGKIKMGKSALAQTKKEVLLSEYSDLVTKRLDMSRGWSTK